MVIHITAAVVFILGVILYFASTTNAKLAELGRIAAAIGLFWLVASLQPITHQVPVTTLVR